MNRHVFSDKEMSLIQKCKFYYEEISDFTTEQAVIAKLYNALVDMKLDKYDDWNPLTGSVWMRDEIIVCHECCSKIDPKTSNGICPFCETELLATDLKQICE